MEVMEPNMARAVKGEECDRCQIKWQMPRFCCLSDMKEEEAFKNVLEKEIKKQKVI